MPWPNTKPATAAPKPSERSDRCATLTLGYDGQRQATGGTHCW
jgi:hypothetical protein